MGNEERRQEVKRKLFVILLLGAIISLGAIPAMSQGVYSTVEEYEKATGKKIAKFSEAPMLRVKVAAGELPPVEERLPEEPLVVKPVEEIGEYGGTWHRVAIGPGDVGIINSRLTYEDLVRWSPDAKTVVPNAVKSYEVSEDAKTFTFHLRKGMKWSDGAPFTADDILFWYEDVLLNKDLNPVIPKWLTMGGKPVKVEKVDDYTVKFIFAEPYGLFLRMLAAPSGLEICRYPKHYMKQFHPRYAPIEKLEKMAKEEGYTYWYQLWGLKQDWRNPEHPWIWAWIVKKAPPSIPVICERNPYYYKVDPEGNQLPYIDKIRFEVVEDVEMLNMKAVAGEVDMQFRHTTWNNYPLFMANREKGNYRVMKWKLARGCDALLILNLNNKDPVLRKIVETRKFRLALSLAINREEMNELVYLGMGVPRQATVIPECPYYEDEFAKAYAEYDPERTNALLDEIGLKWDKDHKYRLRPDGKTLALTIEFAPVFGPWADAMNLVKEYWEAIGVKTSLKNESRPLFTQRGLAGEMDIGIWTMDRCYTPLVEPHYWLPTHGGTPPSSGLLYRDWYDTNGEKGEKPTGDILKLFELYDKAKSTRNKEERARLAKEILRLNAENIWNIGSVGCLPHLGIVKNNFRNVPEEAISDWLQLTPGNTYPEQYFIKQR